VSDEVKGPDDSTKEDGAWKPPPLPNSGDEPEKHTGQPPIRPKRSPLVPIVLVILSVFAVVNRDKLLKEWSKVAPNSPAQAPSAPTAQTPATLEKEDSVVLPIPSFENDEIKLEAPAKQREVITSKVVVRLTKLVAQR